MKAIHQTAFLILLVVSVAASGAAAGQIKPPPDAPKSWIPERRDVGDGRAAEVEPPLSEAEKREMAAEGAETEKSTAEFATELVNRSIAQCIADASAIRVTTEPRYWAKASSEFGEPYSQALELMGKKQFEDALLLLEKAEAHAGDPRMAVSVEQMRTAIYQALNQPREALRSIERQLASGVLPLQMIEAHCETIQGLKAMQGLPPYDFNNGEADADP